MMVMKTAVEKAEQLGSYLDTPTAETKELCWDALMVVGRELRWAAR